jgi:hypothetical protein
MGGFNSLILITDRWSGLHWDYYLSNRIAETIIAAFRHLFGLLDRQYFLKPKAIEMDNELFCSPKKPEVRKFLDEEMFMKIEPSTPYTHEAPSAWGGVIKE